MRVLIVDDDFRFASSLADCLALKDYEVQKAKDGVEALRLIQETFFDVIFLDLLLPKLDGLQLWRMVKGNVTVIIVSAYSDMLEEAEALGAQYTFSKPLDLEEVFRVLEKRKGVEVFQEV